MEKQVFVRINQPCHENWNEMTAAESGRFCDACSKIVVDFTAMDNSEILVFLKQASEAKLCGRFQQNQLDRNLAELPAISGLPYRRNFFSPFQKAAAMIITGFTFLISSCRSDIKGQIVCAKQPDTTIVAKDSMTIDTPKRKTSAHKLVPKVKQYKTIEVLTGDIDITLQQGLIEYQPEVELTSPDTLNHIMGKVRMDTASLKK